MLHSQGPYLYFYFNNDFIKLYRKLKEHLYQLGEPPKIMFSNSQKKKIAKNHKICPYLQTLPIYILDNVSFIHQYSINFKINLDFHDYSTITSRNLCLHHHMLIRSLNCISHIGLKMCNKPPYQTREVNNIKFKKEVQQTSLAHMLFL